MDYSMRMMKVERTPSQRGRQETIRILLVILGVGLLTLWTYWQTLFFFSGQSQFQHASNGASIMLRTVVPLWLACFFPALGLGLGLYTFTHRLPRNASSSPARPRMDYMTETQMYIMLCTAICLFSVNYRILPLIPLMNYGSDRISDLLMTFPEEAASLWGGMTIVEQQAFTGALGGSLRKGEGVGGTLAYWRRLCLLWACSSRGLGVWA